MCEGLVVYLTEGDVTGLASDLAARPDFRWWAVDMVGSLFIEWGNRIVGRQLSAVGASMQFAPEEGPDFIRPLGWEPYEVRSSWLEGRRLGREPSSDTRLRLGRVHRRSPPTDHGDGVTERHLYTAAS